MSEALFEQASRRHREMIYTNPYGGTLTVNDLWDLPLTSTRGKANLDEIAMDLAKQVKSKGEVTSFVNETSKTDEILELKFAIVKYIIQVKLEEKKSAEAAASNRAYQQQILDLIAKKKLEKIEGTSLEELEAIAAGFSKSA